MRKVLYMWRWSRRFMVKYKFFFIWIFLLLLIIILLNLLQVNFIQRSVDAALAKDWQTLAAIAALFVGLTAGRILVNYLYGFLTRYVDINMHKDVNNAFTQAILDLDMRFISGQSSGSLINNHNNDISAALGFIADGYANFLLNPLMAVFGFIYLLHYNWHLSLFAFISTPVLAVLLNVISGRAGRLSKQRLERQGVFLEKIYDIVHGAETIKAFNMQGFMGNETKAVLDDIYKKDSQYCLNDGITIGLILAVTYVPSVMALVYGGALAVQGEIPVSVLFAYAQLIPIVSTPTINIFSALNDMKKSYHSMKRLDEVWLAEKERTGGNIYYPADRRTAIQFDSVSFGYSKDEAVLHNINFAWANGCCAGLAGSSGAGKSTLINLICGFYPAGQGKVSVFGGDVTAWDLTALRTQIAYMPQENFILPGTIYENILYGCPDAGKEAVMEAAAKAGLDFVGTLSEGFDTILAEGGVNLSGGQRQRIGLARAFLRDAPIFIFDEPTASLDPETERFVLNCLSDIVRNKTVVIVSHQARPLDICENVFLLKEGTLRGIIASEV